VISEGSQERATVCCPVVDFSASIPVSAGVVAAPRASVVSGAGKVLCAKIASRPFEISEQLWAVGGVRPPTPDTFDTEERLREGITQRIGSPAQQENL